MTTPTRPQSSAIHGHFGLSYANYLVLHRTLLQSMPGPWQEQFVGLLEELDAAYGHLDRPNSFQVTPGDQAQVEDLSDEERARCGITVADDSDPDEVWYADRDGNQLTKYDYVTVPRADTVPDYQRGRAYLPPDLDAVAALVAARNEAARRRAEWNETTLHRQVRG